MRRRHDSLFKNDAIIAFLLQTLISNIHHHYCESMPNIPFPQVLIYGSSFEVQLDPVQILLSLDQIDLLLSLASLLSRDQSRVVSHDPSEDQSPLKPATRATNPPSKPALPLQPKHAASYESMMAVNRLTLLIYRRTMPLGGRGDLPQMFGTSFHEITFPSNYSNVLLTFT